jgi:hypothetical protein
MDKTEWRAAVERNFLVLGHTPRERLTFGTLILAAIVVRLGDDISARTRAIIDDFRHELPAALMRSGRIGRNRTRYTGVIEFDLLIPRLLGGRKKRELMTELGVDVDALDNRTDRVVIVHLHCVLDHRGHRSRAAMMRDLRHQWPGNWRVHGAKLHEDKPVVVNLTNLASYSTKLKTTYSEAWQGRPTRFHQDYEATWRRWMEALIDDVGLHNLIVSSVKSQKPECTPQCAEVVVPQGFLGDRDAMQLGYGRQGQEEQEQPSSRVIYSDNDQEDHQDNDGRTIDAILGTDRDEAEEGVEAIDPGSGEEARGTRLPPPGADQDDHRDGSGARRGHQDHDGPVTSGSDDTTPPWLHLTIEKLAQMIAFGLGRAQLALRRTELSRHLRHLGLDGGQPCHKVCRKVSHGDCRRVSPYGCRRVNVLVTCDGIAIVVPFRQELDGHHDHGLAVVADRFGPPPPLHEPPRARHADPQSGRKGVIGHRQGHHRIRPSDSRTDSPSDCRTGSPKDSLTPFRPRWIR